MAIVFFRTVIIYTLLLVFMRVLGKRQLGELEISEFVVSVLIADLASLPLQDIGIPLINGLVSMTVIICLELILSGITLRSVKLREKLWGKPCFLIEHGKIDQKQMAEARFSLDELCTELRRQGVLDINTVQYAVLETDGTISVILVPAYRPVTAAQMHTECTDAGYPSMVISQGRILSDNLRKAGRDERWLRAELKRQGLGSAEEVYLMTVDALGQVYCAAKEKL